MKLTYKSNDGVGVAEVEGAGPVKPAPFDLEITRLLGGVGSQEHFKLGLELEHMRFLDCEEQVALIAAVSPVHVPSMVHAHYLLQLKINNAFDVSSKTKKDIRAVGSWYLLSHGDDGSAGSITEYTVGVEATNTALHLFVCLFVCLF